MPRHYPMHWLLWNARRQQDQRIKAAVDEATAKRDLGLERLGHPLSTRRSKTDG